VGKKLQRALKPVVDEQYENEIDMYEPVRKVIQTTLYSGKNSIHIIDTHTRSEFAVDLTAAPFADGRLPYTQRYWVELKLRGSSLTSSNVRGQVLDYLRNSFEYQPWRPDVIGILSDLVETWVFIGKRNHKDFDVTFASTPSLADAILYADEHTKHLEVKLPAPDPRFEGVVEVLSATQDHYLFTADTKGPQNQKHRVVVKAAKDSVRDVKNEINILKQLAGKHKNVANFFWSAADFTQFAITPVGRNITTKEPASVSRSLISGLLDGLEWLHDHHIIHRDIRLSNVIINNGNQAVIIDFQTAIDLRLAEDIIYLGGRICWPRHLLASKDKNKRYRPAKTDDLHAVILFTMHLLFPSQFDAFNVQRIMEHDPQNPPTMETKALLRLWESIAGSSSLSRFVTAAENCCYEDLREMTSLFFSPEPSLVTQ
jgi:serine/threonine protein kinase